MVDSRPIFCCERAAIRNEVHPYKDPYKERHGELCRSFLAFSQRRQRAWALVSLIHGADSRPLLQPLSNSRCEPSRPPHVVFTPEAANNNPITLKTAYVVHLITRYDFGPVISHRYFACPENLEHDWKEASLVQWFSSGGSFKLKAHKWDFKCLPDSMFFRVELRPNLNFRS